MIINKREAHESPCLCFPCFNTMHKECPPTGSSHHIIDIEPSPLPYPTLPNPTTTSPLPYAYLRLNEALWVPAVLTQLLH